MSENNKRQNNEEIRNKKPKSLVRLGVRSNERYDSYGHIIGERRYNVPKANEEKNIPGRQTERAGAFKRGEENSNRRIPDNRTKNKEASSVNYTRDRKSSTTRSQNDSKNDSKKEIKKDLKRDSKSVTSNKNIKNKKEENKLIKEDKKLKKDNKVNGKKNKSIETSIDLSPHEKRLRERKPAKYRKIKKVLKAAGLILVVVVTVALFFFGQKANEDIRKAFLSTGVVERTVDSKVNVIRTEVPLVTDFSGRIVAQVNEGDRVAAGMTVAYVVKPEYESELVALRKIEDKISAAQNVSAYVESDYVELSELNASIYDTVKEFAKMASDSSNFSSYTESYYKAETLFETKHEIIMNIDTTDAYITELKNQRNDILNNMSNYMQPIITETAGVVSFYTDAYCMDASNMAAQISDFISKSGESNNSISSTVLSFSTNSMQNMMGNEVSAGQAVAMVTPDIKYYVTADISGLDSSIFYEGKEIQVRSKNKNFQVEGKIISVCPSGSNYIIIECSSGINGVVSERIIDAELVIESVEGLKVPKRALTDWDSARVSARITILRSNYVSYVTVNVLAEEGEYAIISKSNNFVSEEDEGITSVRVNDIYIVNYEKVSEGEIIGG